VEPTPVRAGRGFSALTPAISRPMPRTSSGGLVPTLCFAPSLKDPAISGWRGRGHAVVIPRASLLEDSLRPIQPGHFDGVATVIAVCWR